MQGSLLDINLLKEQAVGLGIPGGIEIRARPILVALGTGGLEMVDLLGQAPQLFLKTAHGGVLR